VSRGGDFMRKIKPAALAIARHARDQEICHAANRTHAKERSPEKHRLARET
jgi:hypothetical protein